MSLQDTIGWAALFDLPSLFDVVIKQAAISQLADARGHDAAADEIRELFNEIRYQKRLDAAEALNQWMDANHLDLNIVQTGCGLAIRRRKLRASIG